jgi:hypothetical protein
MLRHVTSALGILIAADNIIVAEDTLYIAVRHLACRHQQPAAICLLLVMFGVAILSKSTVVLRCSSDLPLYIRHTYWIRAIFTLLIIVINRFLKQFKWVQRDALTVNRDGSHIHCIHQATHAAISKLSRQQLCSLLCHC